MAYHLEKAVYLATHGRKGPVWIDIPPDIQGATVDTEELIHFDANAESPETKPKISDMVVMFLKWTIFNIIGVENYMKKRDFNYFPFSVDDNEAAIETKRWFGDICIMSERSREGEVQLTGIENISEVILLSKCNAFAESKCSASIIAYLLNGKNFEDINIYNGG